MQQNARLRQKDKEKDIFFHKDLIGKKVKNLKFIKKKTDKNDI
jgi:hypothetical protein